MEFRTSSLNRDTNSVHVECQLRVIEFVNKYDLKIKPHFDYTEDASSNEIVYDISDKLIGRMSESQLEEFRLILNY